VDEADVIARLRRIATDPAARGLQDDAALLDGLVLTHDSIAENVHFLSTDPPASVGWKLVTVNLSDLAAKGAEPAGALLSMALGPDAAWDAEFLTGVEHACESYRLIGGDTIALPVGSARVLGLTAIGRAGEHVPDRAGGLAGDRLWLIGSIGDAAAGLQQLRADPRATGVLVEVYRRPVPLLVPGRALARHAHAMMDVSDGLLLDARRIAEASGCGIEIDLATVPLSDAFRAELGDEEPARLFAATGGDDYALLAALPVEFDAATLCLPSGTRITAIGKLVDGEPRVRLTSAGRPIDLPESLGFEHSRNQYGDGPGETLADRP
jgi:thiamine-monophosphate kinase